MPLLPYGSPPGLTVSRTLTSEVPAGTIGGGNVVFTLAHNYIAGSTKVYLNGLRQRPGVSNDYIETGSNIITFNNAPIAGDEILCDYLK